MEEVQVLFPRQPVSHPVVHPLPAPVEAPAPAPPAPVDPAAAPAVAAAAAPNAPAQGQGQGQEQGGPNAPPGVRMRAPTRPRLWLRILQALLAAAALAPVASARDFASVTAFRFLVSATALQCLWCLALSILYYYALLVGRSYRSRLAVAIICAGDWITGALTFSAACASASITTFLNNDMEACYENQCPSFMSATAMAFLSWFSVAPGCVSNLIEVVYKLQRPQQ